MPDLRLLQMRLDGLAQTMQDRIFRTAVSPVVREGADASCGLFTPEGEVIALSEAIPLLLGALPGVVRAILGAYPVDTMGEGDLFLCNDPFSGGTHLPDIAIVQPILADGKVVALSASLLHHQDVGGTRPGSVPPDATEIHHEGLRLPPMRAGREGRLLPEIARLIRCASRTPDIVLGDLAAQIAAGQPAAAGVQAICGELGQAGFSAAVAACLDRTEADIDARLRALPPGPFTGADALDPVPGLGACEVRVQIRLTAGRLDADFTGSSPQVAAPVNCVRSGPLSAVFYALVALAGPGILRNGGLLRRIRLTLPEASIVNAAPPAAVNARTNMVRCITSAVLQAVGQADPDRMPAPNSGMSYVIAFSGRHADGSPFLSTEIVAGGSGGGPDADGAAAISTDVGNAMNMPAEALEAVAPIRLLAAHRRAGSGGDGRYRGGDGVTRLYEALADGIAVSIRGERFQLVPQGLHGGGAPQPAAAMVQRADGRLERLGARSAVTLNAGDRLVIESCGGAGYGLSQGAE